MLTEAQLEHRRALDRERKRGHRQRKRLTEEKTAEWLERRIVASNPVNPFATMAVRP